MQNAGFKFGQAVVGALKKKAVYYKVEIEKHLNSI